MNRNPRLRRQLCGQFVKPKGREKADDGFRCALTDEGKTVVFRRRVIRVSIEPAAYPSKPAGTGKEIGIVPGDSPLFQVARANNALFLRQRQRVFHV